ncbi:hypothetical protein FOZ62_022835 [Perkinsus olseni]|uniref:Uncharacterized protein n=1 Tax=Perkinsus olseni TaxID=32597 RepID=A0A7J6NJM4_PEROL|nr:hypothetical protein FOZ62_022835 [Perkinsus olseni]
MPNRLPLGRAIVLSSILPKAKMLLKLVNAGTGDDVVIDDELNACSESTSAASDEEPTAAGTPSVNVSFDQDL